MCIEKSTQNITFKIVLYFYNNLTRFNYLVVSMLKSSFFLVLSWLTVTSLLFVLETSEVNKHPAYQFTYSASSDLENSVVKGGCNLWLAPRSFNWEISPMLAPSAGPERKRCSSHAPCGKNMKHLQYNFKATNWRKARANKNFLPPYSLCTVVQKPWTDPICGTHTTLLRPFSKELWTY